MADNKAERNRILKFTYEDVAKVRGVSQQTVRNDVYKKQLDLSDLQTLAEYALRMDKSE